MSAIHRKQYLPLLTIFIAAALILTCTVICVTQGIAYAARGADTAIQADVGVDTVATVKVGETVTEYADFGAAWNATEGQTATVTLYADVTAIESLPLVYEENVTLDLNGHILRDASDNNRAFIELDHYSELTIIDSNVDAEIKTTHKYYVDDNGLWVFDEVNGTQILEGGVITGGKESRDSLIDIMLGTLKMTGGAICGNNAFCVHVENWQVFEMTGGKICGNRCGVSVMPHGEFKVSGTPIITGNKDSDGIDRNVFVNRDSNIKINGSLEKDGKKAQMGVSLENGYSGAFTSGYSQNCKEENDVLASPNKYFFSDKVGNVFVTHTTGGDIWELGLSAGNVTVQVGNEITAYTGIGDSSSGAWKYANDAGTATVTLYADVVTASALSVGAGKNITLDLNGHMLKYSSSSFSSVITVSGSFILTDSEKDLPQKDKTPHNYNVSDGLWVFDDNGDKTMYGGVLTGGSGQEFFGSFLGGGVYVNSGSFEMNGGAIAGNRASAHGGGVYTNSGSFTMNGGMIAGNKADMGLGGGVSIGAGVFTMTDGAITENSGGGVNVNFTNEFHISGTPKIRGNGGENIRFAFDTNSIIIDGALTEGAEIGISKTGAVATGYNQSDKPSKYFIPDNSANNCIYVSDETSGTVSIGPHTGGAATCVVTRVCENCGESYGEIDENNHNPSTAWLIDTESGKHYHTCEYGCDTRVDEAAHNYIQEVVSGAYFVSSATCTAKAVYYKSCVCGAHGTDTFEDGEIDEHTLQTVELKAATCTAFGELAHDHCTVCGKNFIEGVEKTAEDLQIAKAEHTPTVGIRENEKAATCTQEGSYDEVVYCSVCGEELSRTPKTIDKIAHDEEIISAVAATCTAKGRTEGKKCKVCGTVMVAPAEIAMIPHTEVIDEAVLPTCTTDGKSEGKHCSVCGYVIVAQITAPAFGHDYGEWTVAKAATCTEVGVKTRVCSHDSKHVETDDIAALGHDYGDWVVTKLPTAMQDGEQRRFCSHDSSHFESQVLDKLTDFDPNKPSNDPSDLDNANKPSKSQFDWLIIVVVLLSLIIAGEVAYLIYRKTRKVRNVSQEGKSKTSIKRRKNKSDNLDDGGNVKW